jgi:hypothetical protein
MLDSGQGDQDHKNERKKNTATKTRDADWEPERTIHGFREDGTDLVVFDRNNLEMARFSAANYESWVVKGYAELEP